MIESLYNVAYITKVNICISKVKFDTKSNKKVTIGNSNFKVLHSVTNCFQKVSK